MKLKGKRIGFAMTGAFGALKCAIEQLNKIVEEEKAEVVPIMSYNAYGFDTKFGKSLNFVDKIEKVTRKKNNSHNTMRRENIKQRIDGYIDNCTCNRKYYC